MVGAQQRAAVGQFIGLSVAEDISALRLEIAAALQVVQICVKGDLAQNHHHFDVGQRGKFAVKIAGAVGNLFRRGLVFRRSATDRSGNVGVQQAETVFTVSSGGLGGKPRFVQHGIEKIAGAIAGKGTAGAV